MQIPSSGVALPPPGSPDGVPGVLRPGNGPADGHTDGTGVGPSAELVKLRERLRLADSKYHQVPQVLFPDWSWAVSYVLGGAHSYKIVCIRPWTAHTHQCARLLEPSSEHLTTSLKPMACVPVGFVEMNQRVYSESELVGQTSGVWRLVRLTLPAPRCSRVSLTFVVVGTRTHSEIK